MQTRLVTDAVVELTCECGNTLVLSSGDAKVAVCSCGRKYKPELRIYVWEKDELILVGHNPEKDGTENE